MTGTDGAQSKRALVYGYYGHGNLGDELALRAINGTIPAQSLWVTSPRPAWTRSELGLESVYTRDFMGKRFHVGQRLKILRRLRDSAVVVLGGGTFIHDHGGKLLRPGPWLPFLLGRARRRQVPVVALSIGLGPLRTRYSRAVARSVLRKCDTVLFRDPASLALAQSVCPEDADRFELGADLAFLAPTEGVPAPPAGRRDTLRVGINLIAHEALFGKHTTPGNPFEGIARGIDAVTARGHTLRFFPFQVTSPNDGQAARRLAAGLAHPASLHVEQDLTPRNILPRMRGMDLFVGTRLHSIVCSYILRLPFLAFPYHEKVTQFLADIGAPERALSQDDCVPERLPELLEEVQRRPPPSPSKHLLDRIERTRNVIRENVAATLR